MKIVNWASNPLIQNIHYLESTITSINIESLNTSKSSLKATQLANNITFTIPIKFKYRKNYTGILVCSYYSFTTNKWETYGCHLLNVTKENYTCTCSHLTDFGVTTLEVIRIYEKSNVRYVF